MFVALFALLSTLFFGSEVSPFVIPDAEKNIISVIEDSERKKEAKTVIKIFNKDFKKYNKAENKRQKNIIKLNNDFTSSADGFKVIFDEAKAQRITSSDNLIKNRLKVQELLTDNEWTELIKITLSKIEKKSKKNTKKEIKTSLKKNKTLNKIKGTIVNSFPPEKQTEASKYFEAFETNLTEHIFANKEYASKMLSLAENKNANQYDISELVDMQVKFRNEIGLSFIDLRTKLVSISTEKNWPKVAKALSELIK